MKRILVLVFSLFAIASFGQGSWQLTGAKNRWGSGVTFSTKDTSAFTNSSDTNAITVGYNGRLNFKRTGYWNTFLYTQDTAAMLSGYTRSASGAYKLFSDTLFTNGYATRGTLKKSIDSLGGVISGTGYALLNGQNDFSQRQRWFNTAIFYGGLFSANVLAQAVASGTAGLGVSYSLNDTVTRRGWYTQLNTTGAYDMYFYNGFTNTYNKRASLDSLGILTARGFTQSATPSNTFLGPTTIGQTSDNSLGSPVGYGVVNGSLLINGYGANGLNAISFNNSNGDQFLSSQSANNSYSKGVATSGGTYLWKDYSGGATVRGAVTEGEAVKMHLVIGGASGKEFWYDAANSRNVWLIDYGNQLVTSYFPITTTAKVTAGTLSVTDRATFTNAVRVGATVGQLGANETGTFYNNAASWPVTAVSTSQSVGGVGVWNTATSGNNDFIDFYTDASPTLRGSITYNRGGGLVAYNTTSDRRSKNILGSFTTSGAMIDSINIYRAIMKGATIERPMVIADELETVAPFAVTGTKNAIDAKGNPIYQQVDYQSLIPLLISEIKSLRERVAKLENK